MESDSLRCHADPRIPVTCPETGWATMRARGHYRHPVPLECCLASASTDHTSHGPSARPGGRNEGALSARLLVPSPWLAEANHCLSPEKLWSPRRRSSRASGGGPDLAPSALPRCSRRLLRRRSAPSAQREVCTPRRCEPRDLEVAA